MYTTDSIPVADTIPRPRHIREAWIVAVKMFGGGPDDVLSLLQEEAGKRGADAIIAVRLGMGAWDTGWINFAYGTAVKLGTARIPKTHPTSVRVVP